MPFTSTPTDDYISFFLKFPLGNIFLIFLLGMARIITVLALAPFFGAKLLSNTMKIGFTIVLVPIFLPIFLMNIKNPIALDWVFMLLIIKEVLIGLLLGFFLSIPYYYAQAAGDLIDHQRGAQSLQVTDPSSQTQASPIGLLYGNITLITFFMIGGPFLFFQALITSYNLIPVDAFFNTSFFSSNMPFWNAAIKVITHFLTMALQLSAPSLIIILMSDLFLGIANRMAPQVQISFLLWALKAFFGIAILWAGWWLILKEIDITTVSWMKMYDNLVKGLKG